MYIRIGSAGILPSLYMHASIGHAICMYEYIVCAEPFCLRYTCMYEYVMTLGPHTQKALGHSRVHKKNLTTRVTASHSKSLNIWAHIQPEKRKRMLGWDLRIISTPSRHQFTAYIHRTQARWLRMCKITSIKKKLQSRTRNKQRERLFRAVLPAFSTSSPKRTKNLSQTIYIEQKTNNQYIKHGPQDFCLHNSAFSRPIWRISASRPAYSRAILASLLHVYMYKRHWIWLLRGATLVSLRMHVWKRLIKSTCWPCKSRTYS